MSYRDPYSGHYAAGATSQYYEQSQPQYAQPSQEYNPYPPQQNYDNAGADPYYQYPSNSQPYQDERRKETYQDDYNYSDNQPSYNYPPVQRQATQKSTSGLSRKTTKPSAPIPASRKEAGFERGGFTSAVIAPKDRTPRALRAYRYDHQGNLWMKGGRTRAIGRFCFCTVVTVLFLTISIILALALWIRPPSIVIGSVQTETADGSPIQSIPDGLQVRMAVNISVTNPSYLTVDFKKINAEIFYPINNTAIGEGHASDLSFKSDSQTNFTFPFALIYKTTLDPQSRVIADLALKCGSNSDLTVNYKITLGIRIALVTISPVIENKFTFPCPIPPSDLAKFLGGGR